MSPIQAVVFDLDGTLLDTLSDIAAAANFVMAELSMHQHPEHSYRQFVGLGVRKLFEAARPEEMRTMDVIDECAARFQVAYEREWDARTTIYDGVDDLLDALVDQNLPLAVLSNKPHPFTVKCVERFLSRWPWAMVLGQSEAWPRKPDPAGALEIARHLQVLPPDCLYVGDTKTDMQTAVGAGMLPVGVAWGFREAEELLQHGAVVVLQKPRELLALIVDRRSPSN